MFNQYFYGFILLPHLFYLTYLFVFIIISFFNTSLAIFLNLANYTIYNFFNYNALAIINKIYFFF